MDISSSSVDHINEWESWDSEKKDLSPSGSNTSGKENAKLVTTTTVNNRTVKQTLLFNSCKIPERGSDEMFDAIFKAAKSYGGLTTQDLTEIERDKAKFWGTSAAKMKKTKASSTKTKTKSKPKGRDDRTKTNTKEKKCKSDTDTEELLDLPQDQDTLDILAEADALINGFDPPSSSNHNTTSQASSSHSSRRKRITRSKKTKVRDLPQFDVPTYETYDLLDISDDEDMLGRKSDGRVESQLSKETESISNLMFFSVNLKSQSFPIRINEKEKILEVRKILGMKADLPPECLTMFLGDDVQLEDHQTVKESGLTDFCNIDAYYKNRSHEELYMADSTSILRFKLQTSDRRGRQTVYIYAKKDEPMRKVRDQYAKELGLEPSQLRLMFDGDCIDLDSLPESCDLEGEECIDVVIK